MLNVFKHKLLTINVLCRIVYCHEKGLSIKKSVSSFQMCERPLKTNLPLAVIDRTRLLLGDVWSALDQYKSPPSTGLDSCKECHCSS